MAKKVNVSKVVKAFKSDVNDPLGSYTGRPVDGGKPVQDVDDL